MNPTERSTVLVLQHISCEPPATYEEILDAHGYRVHRVELDEGEPLPDHHDFAAVIVMGGPMGALDDVAHPWLAAERAYIARAVAAGVPYWGVCLGAQLLAAALGARVYTGPAPEVGTYDVELTEDAAGDPVFGLLPDRFSVFQWHSDTFDLPAGARRLAASAVYDNQVFALGSAYGVQFHVEVGAGLAAEWAVVDSYRSALERLYGAAGTQRVLDELAETAEANRKVAGTVFEAWLATFVLPGR
ncbi:type 1 glutamine amidotransferase [Nocardioides sp. BYT-33-1]|uniref:type 1 glutamine amidotransferase n=1 Tax=Nocardioides sp. BYT-33-1 TaxID=3416952 RepID=UPI003F533782